MHWKRLHSLFGNVNINALTFAELNNKDMIFFIFLIKIYVKQKADQWCTFIMWSNVVNCDISSLISKINFLDSLCVVQGQMSQRWTTQLSNRCVRVTLLSSKSKSTKGTLSGTEYSSAHL